MLVYKCEYARSDRSTCNKCKQFIAKGCLRIASMPKATKFDGQMTKWFHHHCFFLQFRPKEAEEIDGFEKLLIDDQKLIKESIKEFNASDSVTISPTKRKITLGIVKDFRVEKSKSNRTSCKTCQNQIAKNYIRFCKTMPMVVGQNYPENQWFCESCFISERENLGFILSVSVLSGYETLDSTDKIRLSEKLPSLEPIIEKTRKTDSSTDPEQSDTLSNEIRGRLNEQSSLLKKFDVELRKMALNDVKTLYKHNNIRFIKDKTKRIEHIADALVFGLPICECGGCMHLEQSGYNCMGKFSEGWKECSLNTDRPKRQEVSIPDSLKHVSEQGNEDDFRKIFETYKFEPKVREFNTDLNKVHENIKKNDDLAIEKANSSANLEVINSKGKAFFSNDIDPDSELVNLAHILRDDDDSLYCSILINVNIDKDKNSYYKLQLLEDNQENGKYWVFKSWGRIGTVVGNNKLELYEEKENAIKEFKDSFFKWTKNYWQNRSNFVKYQNCYYPFEIENNDYLIEDISAAMLSEPVKDLIKAIFDVAQMKKTMIEFELDYEKMPITKLSKDNLLQAFTTLKQISLFEQLSKSEKDSLSERNKLKALCDKFYTLIPHSFGKFPSPLIKDPELIAKKNEMLQSLMNIEVAYDIIKKYVNPQQDYFDFCYNSLNTTIGMLNENDEEFRAIETYMKNSHAKTRDCSYTLELVNIFKVKRDGDDDRFKEFESTTNRFLLWHPTRLTNYVQILAKGLQIPEEEAPDNGYRFGKGVYFADCVTKSAECCNHNSSTNETTLMLLSEVALGKSLELTEPEYINSLNETYQSVKYVAGNQTHLQNPHVLANGLYVPIGKIDDGTQQTFNEYVIYNVNQIKIRYIVCAKFNDN